MSTLFIIVGILFVAVLFVTRMANKQRGGRQKRDFKTNYYSKKKQE